MLATIFSCNEGERVRGIYFGETNSQHSEKQQLLIINFIIIGDTLYGEKICICIDIY